MNTELPLRDIHLPAPVSWWPPAPGWWLAVLGVLIITAVIIYWLAWRKRRLALSRAMQHELLEIKQRYLDSGNSLQLTKELSILLRRTAISIQPRASAAGITGDNWLGLLDSIVDKNLFETDTGRQLLSAPYQPAQTINATALLELAEQWLSLAGKKARTTHA